MPAYTANGIQVTLPTAGDSVFEGPEDFELSATLTGNTANGTDLPSGNTATGIAVIVDDGTGPGENPDDDRPAIAVEGGGRINEGQTAAFTVTLTHETEADVVIALDINPTGSNPIESNDVGEMVVTYEDANGVTQTLTVNAQGEVTVPAGVTELSVTVPTVQDAVYEGEETFELVATDKSGVTSNGSDQADATVVDDGTGPGENPDDDRPAIAVEGGGRINEGQTAAFTVTLTHETEADVVIALDINPTGSNPIESNDVGEMVVTYEPCVST